MDRCPNCRARLDEGADHCRRCGLELALLRATEDAAAAALTRGLRHLAHGDATAATRDFLQARSLRADPLTALLLDFIQADAWGEEGLAERGRIA